MMPICQRLEATAVERRCSSASSACALVDTSCYEVDSCRNSNVSSCDNDKHLFRSELPTCSPAVESEAATPTWSLQMTPSVFKGTPGQPFSASLVAELDAASSLRSRSRSPSCGVESIANSTHGQEPTAPAQPGTPPAQASISGNGHPRTLSVLPSSARYCQLPYTFPHMQQPQSQPPPRMQPADQIPSQPQPKPRCQTPAQPAKPATPRQPIPAKPHLAPATPSLTCSCWEAGICVNAPCSIPQLCGVRTRLRQMGLFADTPDTTGSSRGAKPLQAPPSTPPTIPADVTTAAGSSNSSSRTASSPPSSSMARTAGVVSTAALPGQGEGRRAFRAGGRLVKMGSQTKVTAACSATSRTRASTLAPAPVCRAAAASSASCLHDHNRRLAEQGGHEETDDALQAELLLPFMPQQPRQRPSPPPQRQQEPRLGRADSDGAAIARRHADGVQCGGKELVMPLSCRPSLSIPEAAYCAAVAAAAATVAAVAAVAALGQHHKPSTPRAGSPEAHGSRPPPPATPHPASEASCNTKGQQHDTGIKGPLTRGRDDATIAVLGTPPASAGHFPRCSSSVVSNPSDGDSTDDDSSDSSQLLPLMPWDADLDLKASAAGSRLRPAVRVVLVMAGLDGLGDSGEAEVTIGEEVVAVGGVRPKFLGKEPLPPSLSPSSASLQWHFLPRAAGVLDGMRLGAATAAAVCERQDRPGIGSGGGSGGVASSHCRGAASATWPALHSASSAAAASAATGSSSSEYGASEGLPDKAAGATAAAAPGPADAAESSQSQDDEGGGNQEGGASWEDFSTDGDADDYDEEEVMLPVVPWGFLEGERPAVTVINGLAAECGGEDEDEEVDLMLPVMPVLPMPLPAASRSWAAGRPRAAVL